MCQEDSGTKGKNRLCFYKKKYCNTAVQKTCHYAGFVFCFLFFYTEPNSAGTLLPQCVLCNTTVLAPSVTYNMSQPDLAKCCLMYLLNSPIQIFSVTIDDFFSSCRISS